MRCGHDSARLSAVDSSRPDARSLPAVTTTRGLGSDVQTNGHDQIQKATAAFLVARCFCLDQARPERADQLQDELVNFGCFQPVLEELRIEADLQRLTAIS